MAADLAEALARRGVDESAARIAARVGIQVFLTASERWLDPAEGDEDLVALNDDLLSTLRAIMSTDPRSGADHAGPSDRPGGRPGDSAGESAPATPSPPPPPEPPAASQLAPDGTP